MKVRNLYSNKRNPRRYTRRKGYFMYMSFLTGKRICGHVGKRDERYAPLIDMNSGDMYLPWQSRN